ncbi:MAG: DUF4235 domain-containing protein [Actinomycetales bacterium]|nr:DUF4235 domain-containing protein [Actinomycetales bacterium]
MSHDATLETVDRPAEGAARPEPSNLVKIVAPIATIVAAGAVRRLLDGGYRKVLGTPPPRANDRSVPMRQVLLWAAATAAAVAVVSVVVDRLTAPRPPV